MRMMIDLDKHVELTARFQKIAHAPKDSKGWPSNSGSCRYPTAQPRPAYSPPAQPDRVLQCAREREIGDLYSCGGQQPFIALLWR